MMETKTVQPQLGLSLALALAEAERDAALSVNKQLLEALEKLVERAEQDICDPIDVWEIQNARAAILAAKASS